MTRRRVGSLLAVFGLLLGVLSLFVGTAAADNHHQHQIAWQGHGAEHQPEGEDCFGWHFVLTPGGKVITGATLNVVFESSATDSVPGQPSGGQDQGAWHFNVVSAQGDRVESAVAGFDTADGETGNHVLTISDADCDEPGDTTTTTQPEDTTTTTTVQDTTTTTTVFIPGDTTTTTAEIPEETTTTTTEVETTTTTTEDQVEAVVIGPRFEERPRAIQIEDHPEDVVFGETFVREELPETGSVEVGTLLALAGLALLLGGTSLQAATRLN